MADRGLATFDFEIPDTTDIGGEWDAGYTTRFNLQAVGQRLRGTTLIADNQETFSTILTPPSLPCWAACLIPTITGASPVAAFLMLRFTAPATVTGYDFFAARNIGDHAFITRYDNNVPSYIAVDGGATTWAVGDQLKAEITFEGPNQRLKLYQNGTLVLSVIDNTYLSGRYGVGIYVEGSLANLEVDHVAFGDVAQVALGDDEGDSFQVRQAA